MLTLEVWGVDGEVGKVGAGNYLAKVQGWMRPDILGDSWPGIPNRPYQARWDGSDEPTTLRGSLKRLEILHRCVEPIESCCEPLPRFLGWPGFGEMHLGVVPTGACIAGVGVMDLDDTMGQERASVQAWAMPCTARGVGQAVCFVAIPP